MQSAQSTVVEGQLRRARAALEDDLRAAGDGRAEVQLAAFPAVAADAEAALELVYTEFAVREDLGQRPDPADWYRRFPQWRTDLEQMFEVHRELKKEDDRRKSRASAAAGPAAAMPGRADARTIGEYEILGELGRGGMGVVYKARQPSLGRVVAVKVILSGAHAGARERERFRREAETAARLDHPNIVRIYAVGEHDGRAYCAMEYVDGAPLADLLAAGPWPPRRAAELVAAVAVAAEHAHASGVVHRDLKPANVLLAGVTAAGAADHPPIPPGAVKIVDFGLAKSLADGDPGPTRTGDVVGTPTYMAPEQADADAALTGPPTDVWAMGVTLYELLVGHPPFQGGSSAETLQQVRAAEPVPPRRLRPALPRDLEVICLKCLRKRPADRYPTAAALADDLGRWLRGEPVRARPVRAVGHAARWCRRNPAMSALLAAVAILLVAGPVVFAALWLDARSARTAESTASGAKDVALAAKDAALGERDDAIERLEHDRYCAQLAEAQRDLEAGAVESAGHILDATRPRYRNLEWDFLRRLSESTARTRPFSANFVPAVSPDGRLTAWVEGDPSGNPVRGHYLLGDARPRAEREVHPRRDHRIQVRDRSNAPVREWTASFGTAFSASFAAHGRLLVVTSDDPAVSVWEVDTGKLVRELPAADPKVQGVIIPPSAEAEGPRYYAAQAVGGEAVRFWDAAGGKELDPFTPPAGETLVSFVPSPDQRTFAASTRHEGSGQVRRYRGRVADGGPTTAEKAGTTLLAYDPTGQYAATLGDVEDTLLLVEVPTGKVVHRLRTDAPPGWEAAVARDGKAVAAVLSHRTVCYWQLPGETARDVRTDPPLKPDRAFTPAAADALALERVQLTDDGGLTAVGLGGQWLATLPRPGGGYRDLALPDAGGASSGLTVLPAIGFSPDGRRLFASGKSRFDLWDAAAGRCLYSETAAASTAYGSAASRDGARFLVAHNVAGSPTHRFVGVLEGWASDPPRRLWEKRLPEETPMAARYTPDGAAVVVVTYPGKMTTFAADTGEVLAASDRADYQNTTVAVSPDADEVFWMSEADGGTRVVVTDPATGRERRRFAIPERSGRVGRGFFAGPDRLLSLAWATDTVQLWDTANGCWLRSYPGVSGVKFVDLTADGKRFVTLGPQGVAVWDIDTGRKVLALPAPAVGWQARGVAVSPDGGRIAVVGSRGQVRVWDTGRSAGPDSADGPGRLPGR